MWPRLKIPRSKISIRGEAKFQGSSTKTTQLYVQKKRQSSVIERIPNPGSQELWVLIPVLPYLWYVGPFSCWVSVSPSINPGLCAWLLSPPSRYYRPEGGTLTRPSKLQLGQRLVTNSQRSPTAIAPDCWALPARSAPRHPISWLKDAERSSRSNRKSNNHHSSSSHNTMHQT